MSVRVAALLAGTLACTYPTLPLLGDGGPPKDGREPDGHLLPDSNPSDCPLLANYDVVFGNGSSGVGAQNAGDLGSGEGVTQTLEWVGVISTAPSAEVVIQLSAGGGSATPDWPVGDVTPKAGIAIGSANLDAAIAIAVNVGSDGLPEFAYLATTGTLNVNEASPELAGSVTGLSFRQYDNLFGGSAPPAPDADGCMTTMPSIGFDATVSESGSGSSGVSAAPRAVARR